MAARTVDDAEHRYERAADERPSEAVVAAVAEASGRPVAPGSADDEATGSPLSPLFDAIDTDALDSLVASADGRTRDCLVTFSYEDHVVTVHEGAITVTPIA